MATITTDLICNLNQPVAATFLHGNLFSQDNAGNTINVHVMENGEPATIGGTVSANVIRADGNTVAVSGSLSGNQCSVVLPQACYAVPGRVEIIIKLTQSTTITTIAAIVANVYRSTTDTVVDPGTIIPSIQALIEEIEDAVDSIPVDYSGLLATIAADYSSSKTYPVVGMYAWQGGVLKRNIVPITTAETYTAAHWTNAVIGDDLSALKSAMDDVENVIEKLPVVKNVPLTNGYRYIYSSNPVGNTPALSTGTGKYCIVDIGLAKNGGTIKFEIGALTSNSTISLLLTDDDNKIVHRAVTSSSMTYNEATGKYENTYNITNQKYLCFSANTSSTELTVTINAKHIEVDQTLKISGAAADAKVTGDRFDLIDGKPVTKTVALTSGYYYVNNSTVVGSAMPSPGSSSNGKYTATPVDISDCAGGGSLTLAIDSLQDADTVVFAVTDANNIVLGKRTTSRNLVLKDGVYTGTFTIVYPNAKYLYFSVYKGSSTLTVSVRRADITNRSHLRYVATTGDDGNDGLTALTPKATINGAIESGGRTILLAGGKYFQSISLTNVVDSLTIKATEKDGLPVLYSPDSLITEEETAVSGYTKVYSCACTKTFSNKVIWLFQEGVPDAGTEITTADRHPLQRGKAYRCDDTKIALCSASTLADALTEIENATGYKWFFDSANSTLYFSRPQAVSATNPIMGSFESALFSNIKRNVQIEMTGIGIKYQRCNLTGIVSPVVTDCFCGNVCGEAGFQYSRTSGAKFYRCEAFRVFYSSTSGDGFNAHSDNTGDAFAKQTGCFLFDCWSHDNNDDGYSDHERSEMTIYGGLFENNGAGVTPAQGSHCTCYNVLSRYNGEADFFYTGNPVSAEGGVGGQIACFGCVSKGTGTGRGFRLNGSEIQGLFVDCVVIDRQYGFYSESNGGTQVGTLINCSTVNCSTPKSSIFTAVNGVPVS